MIPRSAARRKPVPPSDPLSADGWPAVAADDLPADILLRRLQGVTQPSAGQWYACCPAHLDSRPSLSVTETPDFKLLVYCHTGCVVDTILAAVGLNQSHLFPSDYAVFKALRSGKRKRHALYAARPAYAADATDVPDATVRILTELLRAAHGAAVAGGHLALLAERLSLPADALAAFGVGWEASGSARYVFAERDGKGRVVGLVYRDAVSGMKWCRTGSRRGIIMACQPPAAIKNQAAPLYLPEGHTDTIALHGAGCLAIGRPAARLSGAAQRWLGDFLLAHPGLWKKRPVIVTGDNDEAGRLGAQQTAETLTGLLSKPVLCAFPPAAYKDMREWITVGGFMPGWPLTQHHQPRSATE